MLPQSSVTIRSRNGPSCCWSTANDKHSSDDFIVALIENRVCEVGIALFNLNTFQIGIGQFCDTVGFSKTVSYLQPKAPSNIIFSHIAPTESTLFQVVTQQFEATTITSINRRVYNEAKGASRLAELASSSEAFNFLSDSTNYLALAAAAALVQFVEESLLCSLVPNTVRVSVIELTHYMTIDRKSAAALRIIPSREGGQSILMNVCNHTITAGGSRLLQSNLVQPLRDTVTLRMRQDAVRMLLENPSIYANIRRVLQQFSGVDVDKLISVYVRDYGGRAGLSEVQTIIEATVALNNVLRCAHEATVILRDHTIIDDSSDRSLCGTIVDTILQCDVPQIGSYVSEHIDVDIIKSTSGKGSRRASGALLQVQHCFALRNSANFGILEVKRKAFSDAVEEIFRHYEQTKSQYKINSLKVTFTGKRGYVFSYSEQEQHLLPEGEYFGKVLSTRTVTCTSNTLVRLNDKLTDATVEIVTASESAISAFVPFFRFRMGHLQALAESLALLDLIQSHATLAMRYPSHRCTPTLAEPADRLVTVDGAVILTDGPGQRQNDFIFDDHSRLMLLTGPNASGKTSLLTLFSHLTVLTQIGALLPAASATMCITDRIVAIMPSCDTVDVGTSSFLNEMRQLTQLAKATTCHSLVLVDELGRGTSNAEGCAVALATVEWLADVGCHCIFTTHSTLVPKVAARIPNVRLCCMQVTSADQQMHFHFEVKEGLCSIENYGLHILASVGTDSSNALLNRAQRLIK